MKKTKGFLVKLYGLQKVIGVIEVGSEEEKLKSLSCLFEGDFQNEEFNVIKSPYVSDQYIINFNNKATLNQTVMLKEVEIVINN